MSFTLTDEDMAMGSEFPDSNISDMIMGHFEGPLGHHLTPYDNSVTILDDLYAAGLERLPADKYLLDLSLEKLEKRDYTFTMADIDELQEQVNIINASNYPEELKDAMSKLLSILNDLKNAKFKKMINSKATNQAIRNVYERKTYGNNSAPGRGPANIIRKFAGVKVPRGAEGGSRKKSSKNKKNRKVKKTLRKRN